MVFMRQRGPKQRHDAVPQHLVHGAFVAVHSVHHNLQGRVQKPPRFFRVETLDQLRRTFQVGKHDGNLLALPFQGTARGENLFGQILGRIGQGLTCRHTRWR